MARMLLIQQTIFVFLFVLAYSHEESLSESVPSTKIKIEMRVATLPIIRVYEDGRVERLLGTETVPASLDPLTKVVSKDVVYSPPRRSHPSDAQLSARLYIPESAIKQNNTKLPVLVYFHGGYFCIGSAFSPLYHSYLNTLVSKANVIAISVNYRRAPEDPVPSAHRDSWKAVKWVASHVEGNGPDDWLNRYADYQRVFFNGDSAGGNIAHNMGIRNGLKSSTGATCALKGFNVAGIVLSHPSFWGKYRIPNETTDVQTIKQREDMWRFSYPSIVDCDDPLINPAKDRNLARMGTRRMLVFVAGSDLLRARDWYYYHTLKKSGWKGDVGAVEHPGEPHTFHLFNSTSAHALDMLHRIVAFINVK